MASTYVNDLRLNEMATGDGSGTWGTTTNTNLELIAEAFSYGTEVITTNADTHTTTIADGATDPGRSMYLKYTGTLDSACTITIGPNTVSKVWIIENGTSGSQDIIISQGSGANITIPAGDTKVVYSDGAGAGAAFFDAFANLKVTDPAQTNITSVGTLSALTGGTGDLNWDSGTLFVDSSANNVGIGTTSVGTKLNIRSDASDDGILLEKSNGTDIARLFYDGTSTNARFDMFSGGSATVQIKASGDTHFSGGNVGIGTASPTSKLHLYKTGTSDNTLQIQNAQDDYASILQVTANNDNGAIYNSLQSVTNGGTQHFKIWGGAAVSQMMLTTGGVERAKLNTSGTVFNDTGIDQDFRVESDGNAHMLFVDGGNNVVGLGTANTVDPWTGYSPTAIGANLMIGSTGASSTFTNFVHGGYYNGSAWLQRYTDVTQSRHEMIGAQAGSTHNFYTSADVDVDTTVTEVKNLSLYKTGAVFNEDGIDADFRVESDGNANMLFVDGGNNTVSVGGSTSLGILSVISGVDGTEAAPHFAIQGAASNYRLNMWLDATAAYIGQDSAIREVRIYSGAETAGVALTAGATSWSTFSDERLKENVEPVENALQSLSGLRTVKYHLKDVDGPEDKKKIGVIAQDLVGVLDEVIDPTFRPGDDTEYMGVRYTELVPVLIKAIQEQQNLIESLESRITALES
jgi:hypothetical protein